MRNRIDQWTAKARQLRVPKGNALRLPAICALILLFFVSLAWPRAQSVAIFLLLYITLEYLVATRDSLDLVRDQVQKQDRTLLHFDLACRDKSLSLRVSNLGLSNCLVESMLVRKQDEASFEFSVQRVVESGKTEDIHVPDTAYWDEAFSVDLEFSLKFLALSGEGKTPAKCFNVSMAMNNIPRNVVADISGVWKVRCPKCRVSVQMKTAGLQSFEEAYARKAALIDDLRTSCPAHASEWLLTLEDVQAQRLERLNRLDPSGNRAEEAQGGPF